MEFEDRGESFDDLVAEAEADVEPAEVFENFDDLVTDDPDFDDSAAEAESVEAPVEESPARRAPAKKKTTRRKKISFV